MKIFFRFLIGAFFIFAGKPGHTQRIGLSRAPVPYLEFGLGEDRLGGAKMGYIDTNIRLMIIDSSGEKFRVQLSDNHMAYIPKSLVRTDSFIYYKPYHLSTNVRAWTDSMFDYIQLNMDARLPYKIQQLPMPAELVIDVYGLTTNTNWIIHSPGLKNIKQIWYEQPENDVFRLHIALNSRNHWGSIVYYDKNRLIIKLPHPPRIASLQGLTIAVDAGHGGANSGARGEKTRRYEKEFTLQTAFRLQAELLSRKANVYMTRTSDTDIVMSARTLSLRAVQPAMLISLHHNSTGSDTVNGVGCYYRYPGFMDLNRHILHSIHGKTNMNEWGLVGNFNFALSGPVEYPNCLVELGFLSNPSDERNIADSNFQIRTARAIADGIESYLMESLQPREPKVVQQTVIREILNPVAAPETAPKSARQLRKEARIRSRQP